MKHKAGGRAYSERILPIIPGDLFLDLYPTTAEELSSEDKEVEGIRANTR